MCGAELKPLPEGVQRVAGAPVADVVLAVQP